VLDGALLVGEPKTLPDQAHVEAGGLSNFGCCRGCGQERLLYFQEDGSKENQQDTGGADGIIGAIQVIENSTALTTSLAGAHCDALTLFQLSSALHRTTGTQERIARREIA
jgi:hypothetical protein